MNPVLHRIAQPVSTVEFYDALRAAAPPRFPHARAVHPRRVALAVSGGVDSMALAFLCSRLRYADPNARVSDAPVHSFLALIVDHGLRPGSGAEAAQVADAVRQLGHRAQVWPLKWPESGSTAGALETNARRLRYRLLASRMARQRMVSLLLAHHEDDQYETVLMRLLSGYGLHGGIRGLRGMRPAIDIPECYDLHGAYQSGFWDDQRAEQPYLLLQPSRRERRRIKSALRDDMDPAVLADEMEGVAGRELLDADRAYMPLPPLLTEDLGIMLYRPLLPFSKDRLLATCRVHNVPWFEDPTNHDPGLTLRNAVRRLAAHHVHELPEALRKPSVLRLAARCDATAAQHDAEARRLVARHRIVARFTTNAGTAVARLPRLQPRARARPRISRLSPGYAAASLTRRRIHLRTVAGLVVQTLLRLVTPEPHVSSVTQLQSVVNTLFPNLVSPSLSPASSTPSSSSPKAFSICGVHFVPLPQKTSAKTTYPAWFLSRAPYPSTAAVPAIDLPPLTFATRWDKPPAAWPWSVWSGWHLYDGRFWVRIRTRLADKVVLRPYDAEHSKPFREALEADGDGSVDAGKALAATLKQHAPGKVRYTLPALYAFDDRLPWDKLAGKDYWPPDTTLGLDNSLCGDTRIVTSDTNRLRLARFLWERADHRQAREEAAAATAGGPRPLRLLALPTLGVHVPGAGQWLQWEVRYRKVDTALLEASAAEPLGWEV